MKQPGSKSFILAKNWSRDPIFVVISFLPILSTSLEFSTGHAFHLFKLIFSVVTSFVLLSEEKYQKIKRKSQRIQKNNNSPKIEKKRWAKVEQYLKEHIESAIWAVFRVLIFALFLIIFLLFISLDTSGNWNVNRLATKISTRDT